MECNIRALGRRTLVFLLIQIFSLTLQAEEPEEGVAEDDERNIAERTVQGGRSLIGGSYLALARAMDAFLAGKEVERVGNNSHLKFSSTGSWFDYGRTEYDNKFKAKLRLPGAKKRYRLFVDSNLRESRGLLDRNRSVATGQEIEESESVAGLEYTAGAKGQWRKSLSVGAKLNKGLNTFTRLSFKKHWFLSPVWSSYFRQDIWYLDGVGWGETSRLELARLLGETAQFSVKSEVEVKDEEVRLEYAQTWQITHQVSERNRLTYRIGVVGEGRESLNRFTNVSLRYKLYQDWVFLILTPELFFEKEHDFDTEGSITLKLEFFLTD